MGATAGRGSCSRLFSSKTSKSWKPSWQDQVQNEQSLDDPKGATNSDDSSEVKLGLSSARWRWRTNEAPLHLAALSGRTEALRRLLDAGADVNASASAVPQVEGAETPLHAAVKAGRADIVLMLMRAGADPIRKGLEAGDSPLECARRLGMTDIVKIMEADAIQARGKRAHSSSSTFVLTDVLLPYFRSFNREHQACLQSSSS